MKKRNYEISNDGEFLTVGYDMRDYHRHVVWVSMELPPTLGSSIAEIACAALNAVEAAKHANNSRVTQGPKRPHAQRRTS